MEEIKSSPQEPQAEKKKRVISAVFYHRLMEAKKNRMPDIRHDTISDKNSKVSSSLDSIGSEKRGFQVPLPKLTSRASSPPMSQSGVSQ